MPHTTPSLSDAAARPPQLDEAYTLQRGITIKNRLVKSALHESMGDKQGRPRECLLPLYRAWAEGGIGLSITGNVMVDHRAQ